MKHNEEYEPRRQMSLSEVRAYMICNFDRPLNVTTLAAMANLSPSYFGDSFKKAYGQSVMDYVTSLRINHAKRLLRETDMKLRDIAKTIGYNDEFYFSRKFKKEVGVSPSAYERASGRKVAVYSPSLLGHLVVLGIIPVAAPLDAKWTPYYYQQYQQQIAVHLKAVETPWNDDDQEIMLMAAKPDVVISHIELPETTRQRLSAHGIDLLTLQSTGWREQLREVASYTGKEAACDSWIAFYEAKAAAVRADLQSVLKQDKFAIIRLYRDGIHLYSNKGMKELLCDDLQLSLVEEETETCNRPITLEQLASLEPERILLFICLDESTRLSWLTLQHHSLWRRLRAVQNGYLYPLPSNPWYEYSPVAMNRMLDEMLLMVTGKSPNAIQGVVHGAPILGEL
ncbi:ABC-type Fe3+-hydroxamate transport system substrate-binding protein [Brevibacillus sp. AG162]|uniref:helix-turn-helix domain-containing protein n=1 Tax=Brevibacillus sp. AG162 TaxID=2572910 RepID=UPI0011537AAB|nr:helix-turn-helix domain-containing protein [Brevibacillus sp. AG162]TQK63284.1 ABC-type Fe3+-hydroxamate transport system substrate-binding protein [Brevibacillus sp. AG162]